MVNIVAANSLSSQPLPAPMFPGSPYLLTGFIATKVQASWWALCKGTEDEINKWLDSGEYQENTLVCVRTLVMSLDDIG